MKTEKILAASLLVLCTMPISIFAEETLVPQEVIASTKDDCNIIEKVYVLPKDTDESLIPTEAFTENEIEYMFSEMKVQDNTEEDTKEYVKNISCHTSTNDAESVITLFSPTVDVSTEDGYIGTLTFDYSTLELTPAGYSNKKFTVTEERSYPNLASADTSLVPKTIDKDGVTLTLAGIEWSSSANENVDGMEVAVRYTANAEYTGTATKSYVNGYTASADYKGEVKKVVNNTVTYTVVFKENKEMEEPMINVEVPNDLDDDATEMNVTAGIIAVVIFNVVAFAAGGYALYRFIRKKRKGY